MLAHVVHIPEPLHRELKAHCAARGLSMKALVATLIRRELRAPVVPSKCLKVEEPEANRTPEGTGEDPWAKPPFWAGR